MISVFAMVIASVSLWAASARAATVSVARVTCAKEGCTHHVRFVARRGEANRLTVTRVDAANDVMSHGALLHDDGAPLVAGKGCVAVDAHTARCPEKTSGSTGLEVDLGDRDDIVTSEVGGVVRGGAGADHLTLTDGVASGGPGSDVLTSTASYGASFLDDDGARPSPDRYVGGASELDELSYVGRKTPIRIDVGAGTAGEDTFTGVHHLIAGDADDEVVGSDRPDLLQGGLGNDRLLGLGGNDLLIGDGIGDASHRDRDRLEGGEGDDLLSGRAGARFDCGPGTDSVLPSEPGALARASCELVAGVGSMPARPTAGAFLGMGACSCVRASYVARVGKTVVAKATVGNAPVELRLNTAGRRRLAQNGRLIVAVSIRVTYTDSFHVTHGFRMELKR
jgi:hypothetical protein